MRLAILPDFVEENWPSMDLCAEMLEEHLGDAKRIEPRFRRLGARLPVLGTTRAAFNFDRLLNRFVVYPRMVKHWRDRFDFFHIIDHSYAQLVHVLPADRTGVFCHDLDAFRCLLDRTRDPRPRWYRALARRVLSGLQQAALVFHSTRTARGEIERHGLVDSRRLIHVPYGVSPEFSAGGPIETSLGRYILHVGSNIPRKRVDTVLQTFAGVRRHCSDLRLVKVGPPFTAEQLAIIRERKIEDFIIRRERLTRAELAAHYRGAAAVLLPSESEGFGLPVLEALACGAAVVASDLGTLREVGGGAVAFAPVGDGNAWIDATRRALQPCQLPTRALRLQQAARFSWANHAGIIRDAYAGLLDRRGVQA